MEVKNPRCKVIHFIVKMKPFAGLLVLLILHLRCEAKEQEICGVSVPPSTTNIRCVKFTSNRFCFVSCKRGFKFSKPATDTYLCNYATGTWYEGTGVNEAKWPDCVPE